MRGRVKGSWGRFESLRAGPRAVSRTAGLCDTGVGHAASQCPNPTTVSNSRTCLAEARGREGSSAESGVRLELTPTHRSGRRSSRLHQLPLYRNPLIDENRSPTLSPPPPLTPHFSALTRHPSNFKLPPSHFSPLARTENGDKLRGSWWADDWPSGQCTPSSTG